MGMGTVTPAEIPNFVSASSPEGLRRAMLLNNVKRGSFFPYFDIQFVNGKWIAWFFETVNNSETKNLIQTKG
jgi:hypothetical protein